MRDNYCFFFFSSSFRPAFLLLAALSFASCEQQKTDKPTQSAPEKPVTEAKKATMPKCYEWRAGNSIARAKLTIQNDSVTGALDYLFEEKDNSRGTIDGIMRGDTIFADYTYTSEGKWSVMEVIFLRQGDKLIQGHGDMGILGNKIVYADPGKLNFQTVFKGVICK